MSTSAVIDFINLNRDHYVEELKAYLAIPSISALPEHVADVRRCAEWTQHELERIGMQNARLIETPGHPVVYADWLVAPGAPTILFYGHYDVQPVDPLDLWETPPFEATIRDGELYARGSAADVVVISDTSMFARGVPSICYGLRGLVYTQIDLRSSKTDLHSGAFGGAV